MPKGYLYSFLIKLGLGEFAARSIEFIIVHPGKILLIALLALKGSRVAGEVVRRLIGTVGTRSALRAHSDRAPRRADAIGSAAAAATRVAIWAVAAPLLLGEVGVNLGPFIAGATIVGAALGFGAQTLVKDLLAGFMILSEDQYGVGDTIQVAGTSGTVEDVTLLRTRFRDDDGKVWFVSNGEVRTVANASLGWSRATVDLALPYQTDLDAAVKAAGKEAAAFAEEPEWAEAVLAAPQAYGQAVNVDHLSLRVTARSTPATSASVTRALLARVNRAVRAGALEAGADQDTHGDASKEPVPRGPVGGAVAGPVAADGPVPRGAAGDVPSRGPTGADSGGGGDPLNWPMPGGAAGAEPHREPVAGGPLPLGRSTGFDPGGHVRPVPREDRPRPASPTVPASVTEPGGPPTEPGSLTEAASPREPGSGGSPEAPEGGHTGEQGREAPASATGAEPGDASQVRPPAAGEGPPPHDPKAGS